MNESLRKTQMVYLAAMTDTTENPNDTDEDVTNETLLVSVSTENTTTYFTDESIAVDEPFAGEFEQKDTPSTDTDAPAAPTNTPAVVEAKVNTPSTVTIVPPAKTDAPPVPAAAEITKSEQTVEESIDAAIAEILSNAADDELPVKSNEHSENIEKVSNEDHETVPSEQMNVIELATNEQTIEIVAHFEEVNESNNQCEAPASVQIVIPESPPVTPENELSPKSNLNGIIACLSDDETISDCSQVESLNGTDDALFLGFDESIPLPSEVNLLKRKEVESLAFDDEQGKKRKMSRQVEDKKEKDKNEPDGEEEGGDAVEEIKLDVGNEEGE